MKASSTDSGRGPLDVLIGAWEGEEGIDVAPAPDGAAESRFSERIVFSDGGDVENAGAQGLSFVHYRQQVFRRADGGKFHDETGFLIWDAAAECVMQSFTIPRGVCVLAGGGVRFEDGADLIIEVAARADDPDWSVLQSPFMRDHARTLSFEHRIRVADDQLEYAQTTRVHVYGRDFEHSDTNVLRRVPV